MFSQLMAALKLPLTSDEQSSVNWCLKEENIPVDLTNDTEAIKACRAEIKDVFSEMGQVLSGIETLSAREVYLMTFLLIKINPNPKSDLICASPGECLH